MPICFLNETANYIFTVVCVCSFLGALIMGYILTSDCKYECMERISLTMKQMLVRIILGNYLWYTSFYLPEEWDTRMYDLVSLGRNYKYVSCVLLVY